MAQEKKTKPKTQEDSNPFEKLIKKILKAPPLKKKKK